ncbi:hypothetical protein GPALN_003168 [Globodera pallida]|nr:hypothetical protein GPALN_003168 [Globodera pallida]
MDNESVAANKSHATTCCGSGSNEIGATNKSHATTCCGNGSNEIGATNKYPAFHQMDNKYGANNNKSGATCCCGSVSIETGTYVAAIVVCVDYIAWAIFFFYRLKIILFGVIILCCFAFACLLVIYAQKECNPWLFVPYLIVGVVDLIARAFLCFWFYACLSETPSQSELSTREYQSVCIFFLGYYAVSIPLYVWFYSIICRGFLAVKEVESRRYRPHF